MGRPRWLEFKEERIHGNRSFFRIGSDGQGMALRLLESGYPVGVYNHTCEKAALAVEMSLSVTLLSGLFIP